MSSPAERLAAENFERLLMFEVQQFLAERLQVETPGSTAPDLLALIAIARVAAIMIRADHNPALRLAWFFDCVRNAG